MCQHRVIWKSRLVRERRAVARAMLKGLATFAPDVFRASDIRRVAHRVPESAAGFEWWTAFGFLRSHGFIGVMDRTPKGRAKSYCLTEQAIRWLDWAGFDWKAAA